MEKRVFEISWQTIEKICLVIILLYFLYLLKEIIIWIIFSFIIAILFNNLIDFLEKKKIPRTVSVVFLYFSIFCLIGFLVYQLSPVVASELQDFSQNLPIYLKRISPFFEKFGIELFKTTQNLFLGIQLILGKASKSIISAIFTLFGGVSATLLVIFLAFFLSLERGLVEKIISALFPKDYRERFFSFWPRIRSQVSGWFVSRIIGVIFVGLLSYLALFIFDAKYSALLAIVAGVFDFIPFIGPIIAGVLIALILAMSSFSKAFFFLVAFSAIQVLENNLILPLLFKKFTGLPPVLILISLVVGGKLWGILGAVLAVPLAGVLFELIKDYLKKRERNFEFL